MHSAELEPNTGLLEDFAHTLANGREVATYELDLDADLGEACPEAGRIIDSVNDELATLGHRQKVVGRLTIGRMTLCMPEPPTQQELAMVRQAVDEALREHLPSLSLNVGEIRRKSGESRSQPNSK